MIAFLCLVVAHLEWPLMRVLPLSLLPKSDHRVYVEVYARPNQATRSPVDTPRDMSDDYKPLSAPRDS
jgi:hypothetical protein